MCSVGSENNGPSEVHYGIPNNLGSAALPI